MAAESGIVADGHRRLASALSVLERKSRKKLEAKYADQLAKAGFIQRLRLRAQISREVKEEFRRLQPSPYALYVNGGLSLKRRRA